VLDPIYSGGRVIGYTAERSFLHPGGVKGAVKLLQQHAVELLQAEGLARLNLGLAVGYEVKPGAGHGLFRPTQPTAAFARAHLFSLAELKITSMHGWGISLVMCGLLLASNICNSKWSAPPCPCP
jgi:hypothetical protein